MRSVISIWVTNTHKMVDAIVNEDFDVAISIIETQEISLSLVVDDIQAIQYILCSENIDLINILIMSYSRIDLSNFVLSEDIVDKIYKCVSLNPCHHVVLDFSMSSYNSPVVKKLKELGNLTIEIPVSPKCAEMIYEVDEISQTFSPSSPSDNQQCLLMNFNEVDISEAGDCGALNMNVKNDDKVCGAESDNDSDKSEQNELDDDMPFPMDDVPVKDMVTGNSII